VLVLVGNIGQRYFVNSPYMVLENFSFASQLPTIDDAQSIADYVISQFDWGVFSDIRIVYTHMYNALKLLPNEMTILPLDEKKMREEAAAVKANYKPGTAATTEGVEKIATVKKGGSEFEYIPSPREVFDSLVPIYVKGVILGCLVESYASEQSARMTAMNDSTKNAVDMLAAQQLFYNRVRQANITQEVTEIVGGATALAE
jgi:F-type H+-transporting ATPase subunit gamma